MPSAKQLDRHGAQPGELANSSESSDSSESSGSRAVDPSATGTSPGLHRVVVPTMLAMSSMVMALAWLGHLRFREWPFALAMFVCWLLVLPEYFLNISAIRLGYGVYTGAQMAAFRLCSGVVCVAMVSAWVIGETLTARQLFGFALMIVAMALISTKQPDHYAEEGAS